MYVAKIIQPNFILFSAEQNLLKNLEPISHNFISKYKSRKIINFSNPLKASNHNLQKIRRQYREYLYLLYNFNKKKLSVFLISITHSSLKLCIQ